MSLALLGFAPTLWRETVVARTQPFVPLRRHYEGFLDDTFGKSFCPLLIDRIAFGSQPALRIVSVRRWTTTSKESRILDSVSFSKDSVTLRFFTPMILVPSPGIGDIRSSSTKAQNHAE